MSYYDFDHFWSPREVCASLPPQQKKKAGIRTMIGVLRSLFSRPSDDKISKS